MYEKRPTFDVHAFGPSRTMRKELYPWSEKTLSVSFSVFGRAREKKRLTRRMAVVPPRENRLGGPDAAVFIITSFSCLSSGSVTGSGATVHLVDFFLAIFFFWSINCFFTAAIFKTVGAFWARPEHIGKVACWPFDLARATPLNLLVPVTMSDSAIVVTPGETIARESGTFSFIRGHGTYTVTTSSTTQFAPGLSNNEDEDGVDDRVEEVSLIASVGGVLERVNKLVTAKPIYTRYVYQVLGGCLQVATRGIWSQQIN